MLSFAIIVFREVLEIALVLSVLVVATKGLQSRGRWIGFGIALGVLGSVGVALGAEQISNAMEGMGLAIWPEPNIAKTVAPNAWSSSGDDGWQSEIMLSEAPAS